jgi:glycosyltransferase involved in cell wall biosynthesis
MSSLAGILAARCLRIPVINGSIRSALSKLTFRDYLIKWTSLKSDFAVSNSQAGLKVYGLMHWPRARYIYNGIDFQKFEGIVPQKKGEILCMVANFSRYKDHATAVRAMPIILQALPKARLILVGRDMGTLRETRQLTTELDLENAVEFITDCSHPESIVAASQVGVLLSPLGEGTSNAILEYMALGKPVVATNCWGNAEVIREGETGWLIPNKSPSSLAACAVKLLSNKQLAAKMGSAGKERAFETFSLNRIVKEYESLYDELLLHQNY